MYAIIENGGKQYKASEGKYIDIDLLQDEEGKKKIFDNVLLLSKDEEIEVGEPYLKGVSVEGTIFSHFKGPKLIVFKYRAKQRFRVKTGHRQKYTRVMIDSIAFPGKINGDKKIEQKQQDVKKPSTVKKTSEKKEKSAPPSTAKKSAAAKPKSTTKKATTDKPKPVAKKTTTTKKPVAKKPATAKPKSTAKKATTDKAKPVAKKTTTTKKPVAKKSAAKKPAEKK
jgi:large subunit ribosomal protein L21